MTNTKLIEELITERGLKKKYIARQLGLSDKSLYSKINNKTEFLPSEIVILCDVLGVESLVEKERIFFD